jgi:hypothetical protein
VKRLGEAAEYHLNPCKYSRLHIIPYEKHTLEIIMERRHSVSLTLKRPHEKSLKLDELWYSSEHPDDEQSEAPFWWMSYNFSQPQSMQTTRTALTTIGFRERIIDRLFSRMTCDAIDGGKFGSVIAQIPISVGAVQHKDGIPEIVFYTESNGRANIVERLYAVDDILGSERVRRFRWENMSHGMWWWSNIRYGAGLPIAKDNIELVRETFRLLGFNGDIVDATFGSILNR